ncbi:MAG TPA: elongation factor G [Phycisphaerales bacterium]|nr:elongation factor G [Phycisphaerales bacterium]
MAASKPQDIRNIAFLGHGGCGKTTLGEAMLFAAKVTTRLGSVADGSGILDSSDIAKERQHSVDPALASFEFEGKSINLIDTPGYPDFIGGAIYAAAGADTGVVMISAAAGIEVNTRRMFRMAKENGLAVAIVINKIDAENLDLESLMGQITETFGTACKPLNLPTGGGKGVIDCFTNDSGEADFGDVSAAHTELVENIIEADEEMMEAYLGGEQIPAEKLSAAFGKAMVEGTVIPVFFTAAKAEVGVPEFMHAVVKYFPSPDQLAGRPVRSGQKADAAETPVAVDPSKPFVGQAFKISSDPFVGKLAWVRVLQGTARSDTVYLVRDEKKSSKIGHLFKAVGKDTKEVREAVAGDVIVLPKVEDLSSGDVVHEEAGGMFRAMPAVPTPMYSLAVTPKSRGDEQKISTALSRLSDEDPTFVAQRDAQTAETVISGTGDLHLRIMLTKMKQRFDMEVETKPPKIPYRETISAKAEGHHRHKKQTGGAGQFGEVYLRVEPMERGSGFEFVNDLFGESIPRQFLPAIEKGVHEVLVHGAIAGYPLQDVRVAVYDGKHHPVDSKEVAFKTAGKYAFIDAIQKAKPVLLEPIVNLEISVPQNYMGDIASDLSGRRGRILGQDMLPGGIIVIKAQAPLAEVMQYNSQLRSVTGGQGSYAMEFSHYEPVPGNVQQQIVAAAAKAKEEEKE